MRSLVTRAATAADDNIRCRHSKKHPVPKKYNFSLYIIIKTIIKILNTCYINVRIAG